MTSLDRAHAALQRLQNRCDDNKHRSPMDGASDEEDEALNNKLISVKVHKMALQSVKVIFFQNYQNTNR